METEMIIAEQNFKTYYDSFKGLTPGQSANFAIKYEHSLRVATLCENIAATLKLKEEEQYLAYQTGLYHDIGRFRQLQEFNTFNDTLSVDHAELSAQVVEDMGFLDHLAPEAKEKLLLAIRLHNKLELSKDKSESDLMFARLLRDADKLDILKVITDYYTNPKATPNHTLTWEMPKAGGVSPEVAKQVLAGKLVSKSDVANETDIKIMQLSWVFDINFKASIEMLMRQRYLEKIYATLPKNDTVIEIYRKVKVFAENKILG